MPVKIFGTDLKLHFHCRIQNAFLSGTRKNRFSDSEIESSPNGNDLQQKHSDSADFWGLIFEPFMQHF